MAQRSQARLHVVLIAQFTASVTSLLTVQQLQSTINGVSDLPGKSIAKVPNTTYFGSVN